LYNPIFQEVLKLSIKNLQPMKMFRQFSINYIPLFLLFFCSCKKEKNLFKIIPAEQTGLDFTNVIKEDERHNMIDFSYCYNGGGVGLADLDNDGLPEVFLTGNQTSCRLYQNKGNLQFKDITQYAKTQTSGWCTGVTFGDINTDGLLDIYVCRSGNYPPEERRNLLFLNKGNLQFEECAARHCLADEGWSTQAAFVDFDKDDDLDLYVLNATNDNRQPNRIKNQIIDGNSSANDHFYVNDGTGKFTEISQQVGILDDGWGLGLGVGDFNNDGWEDFYVANDFLGNDLLYLNQQNGTFKESVKETMGHTSHFSMGTAVADMDNDGWEDIFVADMLPSTYTQHKKMAGVYSNQTQQMVLNNGFLTQHMRNTWQINQGKQGPLFFIDRAQLLGVHATDWSWSPVVADWDGDGQKDLFISNGYRHDITDMDFIAYNDVLGRQMSLFEADQIIRNKAKEQTPYPSLNRFFQQKDPFHFSDESINWVEDQPGFSNGAAAADLDGDGDLDIITNNLDAPVTLYENNSNIHNYLTVKLLYKNKNPRGIGTKLTAYARGKAVFERQQFTKGYQSASDALVLSMGSDTLIDSLVVLWPDLSKQVIQKILTRQTIQLTYNNSSKLTLNSVPISASFEEISDKNFITEEVFDDFGIESLLPHRFSAEGPCLAVGDVNGDELDDFFVGGHTKQSGRIFIQNQTGKFVPNFLEKGQERDDTGAAFADVDRDGDLDLVVASGGNHADPGMALYQARLYLNDGRGKYAVAASMPPFVASNGSAVRWADFDRDGDIDLFVGGQKEPRRYGLGVSQLLENQNGQLKKVSPQRAEGLTDMGMVTDAQWADLDGNGWLDLAVVGEMMPLTIFWNDGKKMQKKSLDNSEGLWNCLTVCDLNHDKRPDLLAGNLGLNHRLGVSKSTPLRLFLTDVDSNEQPDPLLSYYENGRAYPWATRDDLLRQIPSLKRQFVSYASFAQADFSTIFPEFDPKITTIRQAVTTQHTYFENTGKQLFKSHTLPIETQQSLVRAIFVEKKGKENRIWLAGNSREFEVNLGQQDGSRGWVWQTSDGKSGRLLSMAESGFGFDGEVRNMQAIRVKNRPKLLVARHKAPLLLFDR
jgi:enediyne biosynthesis protein E4